MAKKAKTITKKSWLERTIGWVVVALFAILPLLYFSGRAASYVTSKQYFFIGAVDLLTVLWVWLLVSHPQYRLRRKTLLALLPPSLLLVSLSISAFVGISPTTSFFSTVESGTGLILLYHAYVFSCIIASLVQARGQAFIRAILQGTLFASVVLAVATFFTGPNGVFDIHSVMLNGSSGGAMMGNVLLVGAYFIFSFFFAVMLLLKAREPYQKVIYGVGALILLISPVYSNTAVWTGQSLSHSYFILGQARIAIVSLVIGVIVAVALWAALQKKTTRIVGRVVLVVCGVLFIIGVQQIIQPSSHIHQFFIAQSGNRILDWQASVQGIKERPWLGWGPENFHVVYQQFLNPIVFSPGHGNEVWALHPHNNTLEVLINGGVTGFVLYLWVLISLFVTIGTLRKKGAINSSTFALLVGMLVAFILQQQMIYDSIVSYVMFFSVIGMTAGLLPGESNTKIILSKSIRRVIGIGIVVCIFPVWLYAAYLPARKVEEFQSVVNAHSDSRIGQYQHLFHSPGSYAIDTDVEFYTSPLFYSYGADQVQIKNNPLYLKVGQQELQALFAAVQPIWQNNPYDYHLTLSLLQLENLYYYFTGDAQALVQAQLYAQRGMMLSPTDPQIYVNYAQTLVYEHNKSAAQAMIEKALVLSPTYQSAIDFKKSLQ